MKAAGVVGGFGTPHDAASNPFSAASGLGDLYNVLYGQKVWSMLNQEVNPLAMLAKRPYTSSGWRVLKSRAEGGSGSAFGIGTCLLYTSDAADEGLGVDKSAVFAATAVVPVPNAEPLPPVGRLFRTLHPDDV